MRGSGPAILLVGAQDEDAEMYRGVAERLPGRTVVTYDRRGTGRSGREGWPTGGSRQHAADAAALLTILGIDRTVVFGCSAGGIVAMRLALRHPGLVRRALIFEAGFLQLVAGGAELQTEAKGVVGRHLDANPGDWPGSVAALSRWAAGDASASSGGLLAAGPGKEWYDRRAAENAEGLIREDLLMTGELPDWDALAASRVHFRFVYGSESSSMFRQVAYRLAEHRSDPVDELEGVGHLSYLRPEITSRYVLEHSGED